MWTVEATWERAQREWARSLDLVRRYELRAWSPFVLRMPGLRARLTRTPPVGDFRQLHPLRTEVRRFLEGGGVPQTAAEDIEFVVGELCSNAVRHAAGRAPARYVLAVDLYIDRVVVTVKDGGPGFSPDGLPAPGTARPDGAGGVRIGGLGIPMVARLTESLEFFPLSPSGTLARATCRLLSGKA
jgi:anti-sigma regulatory factor (Ser/Thr protein kinase)